MKTRQDILKSVSKPEDRLILARLLDKAEFAAKKRKPAHSEFLDPHQASLAEKVTAAADNCECEINGGFPGAERVVVIFYPESAEDDEREEYSSQIFKVLDIVPNARGSLSHRDYLGALMAIGIKREVTGDILVEDERCSVVVLKEIADYIASNLSKVGNIGVKLKILDIMDLSVKEPNTAEIKTTVAALRLDSLCAPAFGISRSKAAEFIKAGKVNLNWVMTQNPDKLLREGDTVSIKGKGRAILEKVGGKTRRDRLAVIIRKLV